MENDWKIVCRKNSIVSKEKQQIIRSFASLNDIITIFHIYREVLDVFNEPNDNQFILSMKKSI